ncbi:hypothetical protein [Arthrobacter sp. PsM3]|uniref:hypothetical protein n=1 Tax=Arthrobacter sp. PsM3 TaxID=3030531 RepID=UPI00263BD007|nr:hypothetical protein [Arthrobacter sp. PsM3]MDN4643326.1 hypothetical protein [Arthrobacter sp. PsM3]
MADLLIADRSALGVGEGELGASHPCIPVRAIDGAVFGEAWKSMPVVKNAERQMSNAFSWAVSDRLGQPSAALYRAGNGTKRLVSMINALFRGDDELARLSELMIGSGSVAMSCRSLRIPA